MGKKYEYEEMKPEKRVVSEAAFTYQAKSNNMELPVDPIERLEMQAEQAIKDFENGLCVPHEEIKRK